MRPTRSCRDAADTNKDGKIDKNEWAAFQKNKALVIKK
jgi:EF hand